MLVKVTTIPKGTRSQLLMGPIDLHDYTIQADVCGSSQETKVPKSGAPAAAANAVAATAPPPETQEIKENKLPDMAVIGQRYTLDLMGSHQQLQIRSWTGATGESSSAKNAPFMPWKADVWYTIKLRAATDGGKAVLQGKVLERGEARAGKMDGRRSRRSRQSGRQPGLVRQRRRRGNLLRQHHRHSHQHP